MSWILKRSPIARVLWLPLVLVAASATVYANHSWDGYHWLRRAGRPQVRLDVGDNVSAVWDASLNRAISDWNLSRRVELAKVAGSTGRQNCRPTYGQIEVCNGWYGDTGWLGIAQIWLSGRHIVQGTTKVNDTYFSTRTYNTPAWRRLVMCQEIAHNFGLDHQDENPYNRNLASCMDYTNDPDGPPSNVRPNAHDYEQLEAIYAHAHTAAIVPNALPSALSEIDFAGPEQWGKAIRWREDGRPDTFMLDFGDGKRVLTHVFWKPEDE